MNRNIAYLIRLTVMVMELMAAHFTMLVKLTWINSH